MKLKKYKHGGSRKKQSNSYLQGGQVKLDKNNDGELTEEDFKLLRKQKTDMKTKKKSLYAEYGALVKAMKKYENGGETDPPNIMLTEKPVFGKKEKPSLIKTYEWTGTSLNDAISDVNTFILNKGNFAPSEKAKMNALMREAEEMLRLGAFGNLESLLDKEIPAYKRGKFEQFRFKGYKEVDPSKVVDGKVKQISGEEAVEVERIRSTRPKAGMKPGNYTIKK